MTKTWQINRRTFLRGVGAMLALPQLDIMEAAQASTSTALPVRFVSMFHPNGVFPKAWNVVGTGSDWSLSPILEPLAELKEDISVVSNVTNPGEGHVRATGAFLTGVSINNRKNGVSVDQFIAQKNGDATRLPSIELGTEPPRQGGAKGLPIAFANTISWSSETTRVSPEINPLVAFNRMFRPGDKQQAANRRSVVDLVLEDAKNLRRRSSQADQHKIEEYLSSVRSVEKQVEGALKGEDQGLRTDFKAPVAGIPQDRSLHLRMMMDLIVLALQTDTTRVATMMSAHGFSRQNFTFIGVKGDHHSISHHKNQDHMVKDYTTVSRWYASQFGYLLNRLKQTEENGRSLLDNTLLLYGSGLKDGNGHKTNDLPLVIAGGAGRNLKQGRHIQCPNGTHLGNLHHGLLQQMGIETDRFNKSTKPTDLS